VGILINTTDFVGKFAIAQNSFSQLGNYITQFEQKLLYKLLGKELADLFIADLAGGVPQTQKYLDIYDPLNVEFEGVFYETQGMKQMLIGFVWFEFQRYDKAKATIAGTFSNANENAREVGFGELNLYGRYNESVDAFNTIQSYCLAKPTDYPEFEKTSNLSFSHWSI
jgi:hypothetical protein